MNKCRVEWNQARRQSKLVAPAVAVLLLLSTSTINAQTTIYSEGFNTPGNGTRYQLIRDYYEVSQPNNLWTTVPNQLPGDNVIVYLEPGDEYIDGTPVPARRATFFADNDLGDQTPLIDLTEDGFALFDAAIHWATDTDGTTPLQINFVIDDDTQFETNNLDITLVDRLFEQGHDVTVTHADMPPEEGDDLIFMASHDNGSAVATLAPEFQTTPTPLISGFFHAASPLGFGSERGENTNGTYDLQIVDATHPLAAGFPLGLVQAVDDAAARQRFTRVTRGQIAPDAKVVATLPGAMVSTPEDFTNFEGEGYLRGGHSTWNNAPEAGEPRVWQTIESLDTTTIDNPQLVLALAAGEGGELVNGPYENPIVAPDNFDYIRVLTDDNADGEFETLTEFVALDDFETDFPGSLIAADGTVLTTEFQTFTFDLPTASSLDLRIDVFTNAPDERIGIDDIRVMGEGRAVEGDCNLDGLFNSSDLECATADTITTMLESLNLVAGDLNADGQVDFGDFLILSANFNSIGLGYPAGDIDVDGQVAFGDFLKLSANFNLSSGALAAVPEPTSPITFMLGVLTLTMWRTPRRPELINEAAAD